MNDQMTMGRQIALLYLYMQDKTSKTDETENFNDFIKFVAELSTELGPVPNEDGCALAKTIINKVNENMEFFDEIIVSCSQNWNIMRMSVVDRNILRMGLAEISMKRVSYRIVINEAVELAKQFGAIDGSPKFVNGVLDAARKKIEVVEAR